MQYTLNPPPLIKLYGKTRFNFRLRVNYFFLDLFSRVTKTKLEYSIETAISLKVSVWRQTLFSRKSWLFMIKLNRFPKSFIYIISQNCLRMKTVETSISPTCYSTFPIKIRLFRPTE